MLVLFALIKSEPKNPAKTIGMVAMINNKANPLSFASELLL